MILDQPDIVAEVKSALEAYLAALDAGDADRLEALFWDSESAVRFGANETLVGKSEIREFRAKRGKRAPAQIDRTVISAFGDHTATVCMVFTRPESPHLIGRWSQHWARIDGSWRITSAHVSHAPTRSNNED